MGASAKSRPNVVSLAAIDAGSNGVRIVIADVDDSGQIVRRICHRVSLRLGGDAFNDGILTDATLDNAVETFEMFRRRIDRHGVDYVRAVATSATRSAANGAELVARVADATGIQIDVIDGLEEAQLIFGAVADTVDLSERTALLIDMGGGSVELTFSHDGLAVGCETLPLGPVRLLQRLRQRGWSETDVPVLMESSSDLVEEFADARLPETGADICIGTGGNLECLAKLRVQMLGKSKRNKIRIGDLESFIPQLLGLSVEKRIRRLGLRPDRADIIAIAAQVLHMIADEARVQKITVPGVGLKDGILRQMIRQHVRSSSTISPLPC